MYRICCEFHRQPSTVSSEHFISITMANDQPGTILVTGGAGFIGSHTCVELLNAGSAVTVFDNFSNSHPEALARVERITGKSLRLVRGDIRDRAALAGALRES